jgi:iron complex outermembrane recepter protein
MRRWLFRLLLITSFFGASGSWAADPKMKFDLRPDEFPKAILEYSHQSKVEVLFLANDSLHKVRTQSVIGEFSPREALQKMLKGTGLVFDFDTDHSVTLKLPPVNAPPPMRSAAKTLEPSIHHLASAEPTINYPSVLAEVTVTGTYLHTAMDVQAPIIYLTRSDFSRAPFPTVQDVLDQLPINSLNAPRADLGINNNYNWGAAVNLRGLGVPATLVLVNGRRQPFSGAHGDFVDVSNIPASAVERIEVLPDGASALYGSDAIAGVVNIILRDDFHGAETQVQYGGTPGGRDEVMASQLLGMHWDTGKAMLAYEYLDATELPASARGYAANADKRPYGGGDYRSFLTDPGNILDPKTQQPVYGLPANLNGTAINTAAPINLQNQFSRFQIFPEMTSNSVYGSVSQQVGSGVDLFAEGRLTRRRTYIQQIPEPEPLIVPSTNPFNPFGATTVVGYNFGQVLGPVTFGADTTNYTGAVGAKFNMGAGWKAELYESYGRETLFSSTYNEVNLSALTAALNSTNVATAFDPFSGQTKPTTLDTIQSDVIHRAISSIETTNFVADGPLFGLPAGKVQLAVGGERREESLGETVPASLSSSTTINTHYSRHVGSAFTELLVPLIGDASQPHAPPRLELNAAARYDDYTDFGHTVNPEFRVRLISLKWLKLRGSWGRSYRAPKLDDLYDSSNNASGLLVLTDPASATGRSTVLITQGTNPNLKQETAATWTAGLDVVPVMDAGLKLSLTYYSIDYEGQITTPDLANPYDILIQENQWAAFIKRNPTQAQIAAICNRSDYYGSRAACLASSPAAIIDYRLANIATTKVSGLDLDVRQSLDSGVGHFDFGFNGSYVFNFDQSATNRSPGVDILNTFGNPLKFRFRATSGWSQRREEETGLAANLAVNFTNGYGKPGSTLLPHIDALATVDMQLLYHTAQNDGPWGGLELSLNAVNVFNQSPPFADTVYGYDFANFQALGRVLSLSMRKKW